MDSKAWMARAMALALVAPAIGACNKEDKTEANIEVQTEPTPPPAPITITINPQGGSMITGELTAMHEADNAKVTLNLTGLTEDKDYDATIRYGDCSIAMNYLKPDLMPGDKAPDAETVRNHDIGDEVKDIDLNKTGTTATGEATIDNDDLRADEPAFVMVTQDAGVGKDHILVGCADLTGHAGMSGMGGMAPPPAAAPSTTPETPGAAKPEAPKKY
jgi:hypothetical protein